MQQSGQQAKPSDKQSFEIYLSLKPLFQFDTGLYMQKMTQQQNLSEFNRYLSNNHDLLAQKHKQYFGKIHNLTIQKLPVGTFLGLIYDIFCFDKYKEDQRINKKILSSLTKNVQDYIKANSSKEGQLFDADKLIDALRYLIEHNDMFHVQYDLGKKRVGQGKEENEKQNVKQEHTLNVQIINEAQRVPNDQSKERDILDKHAHNDEQELKSQQKGFHFVQETNQFDQNPQRLHFTSNLDLLKKNAKLVFLSYCKNQMQLGGVRTFDKLSQEASTMTIGKLLVYAKDHDIMNNGITKQFLMRKFKKIGQGKRAIDFQTFYILLTQLLELDRSIFDKLHLYDQDLYKKLKSEKCPFFTLDQNPRQLMAYRAFTNKLTQHSGKSEEDLKSQLLQKRAQHHQNLGRLRSMQRYNRKQDIKYQSKMISPKDLMTGGKSKNYSVELSFIDKIVQPQDSDLRYLGEYQMEHSMGKAGGQSGLYSHAALKRKNSIVDNIRKRIQQIEHQEIEMTKASPRPSRNRRYQA